MADSTFGLGGTQQIEFEVLINGVAIVDVVSASFTSFAEYLDDQVWDFGSYTGQVSMTLDLTAVSDLSGSFQGNFIVPSAVPETSTWLMLLGGFAFIGFIGWHRSPLAYRVV